MQCACARFTLLHAALFVALLCPSMPGVAAAPQTIAMRAANCRNSPTTFAAVVARLAPRQRLTVVAVRNEWSFVRTGGGSRCWTLTRGRGRATTAAPAATPAAPPRAVDHGARRARNAQGCPCDGARLCVGSGGGQYCVSSGRVIEPGAVP